MSNVTDRTEPKEDLVGRMIFALTLFAVYAMGALTVFQMVR
jgi:hypothetical protein